jgi:DNA-binding transcriptional MerR regulator
MAAPARSLAKRRPLRIGAVCALLGEEFPDISISKIRYLEDQGLVNPARTQGGYRLYRDEDVERLRTILRLQRDEFLPLRVIRDELMSPGKARRGVKKRPATSALRAHLDARELALDELCERASADPAFVRELEQFKILKPTSDGVFADTDVEIVELATHLQRFGIEPRALGKFRHAADNQADLVAKRVIEDLRAVRQDRRERGLEDLEKLAGDAVELSRLLFWQALRSEIAEP